MANAFRPLQGVGFMRRFWSDKPEIAGSLCIFAVGIVGLARYCMIYDKDINHQHRWEYTVIRENEATQVGLEKKVYN